MVFLQSICIAVISTAIGLYIPYDVYLAMLTKQKSRGFQPGSI